MADQQDQATFRKMELREEAGTGASYSQMSWEVQGSSKRRQPIKMRKNLKFLMSLINPSTLMNLSLGLKMVEVT